MIALTFLLGKGANAFQVPFLRANEDLQIDNETEGTAGNEPEGTAFGDGSGDGSGTLNPQFNGCPTDVRFPEGCEILMPPFPTCSNGSYMDWMAYATESGKANCCGDDLSACTCPVKGSQYFLQAVEYACHEIEVCEAVYKGIVATEGYKADLEYLREVVAKDIPEYNLMSVMHERGIVALDN